MAGGGMNVLQDSAWHPGLDCAEAVGVSSSVRPGRGRNRVKTEVDEKVKKPADVRKKSPPARKTPSRGRYVDEYARPAV